MEDTELELLQEAVRPRRLRFVETEAGEFALRPRGRGGRGSRKTGKLVARREREWLLLQQRVAEVLTASAALALQSSLVFAKCVTDIPGGELALRADLRLAPAVTGHSLRLRALLGAAMAPDEPTRSPSPSPEEVHLALRAGLAEVGELLESGDEFTLRLDLGGGRFRTMSIELSSQQVRFALPLLGREVNLDGTDLEIVATFVLGLNAAHYLARGGLRDGEPAAEVVLPLAHLTPIECQLAAQSLAAFAQQERALELLITDERVRQLYAAHHGVAVSGPSKESGS
jgi:hypothetical protein